MQQHERVGYDFADSRTHYLARITSEPDTPVFNLGSRIHIGQIPDGDFRAFLKTSFARSAFTVTPDGVDAVLDLAERIPYNVQLLADACWQTLRNGGTAARARGRPEIARVAHAMVEKLDPFYSPLWTQLTRPADGVAGVRARARGGADIARRVAAVQDERVGNEKDVLFEDQARGEVRLRLQDPFFGIWVRRYTAAP